MPVNSLSEIKQGVEKTKFSLSLNRNNATNLNRENKVADIKENNTLKETNNDKENKLGKRPLKRTYYNTLNAAKKLKPLTEVAKPKGNLLTFVY